MSRRATQPKTVEAVVPLCTVIFSGKRGVVERNRASDEAQAVGERGRVREGGWGRRKRRQPAHRGCGPLARRQIGLTTPKDDRGKHVLKPEGASAVRG